MNSWITNCCGPNSSKLVKKSCSTFLWLIVLGIVRIRFCRPTAIKTVQTWGPRQFNTARKMFVHHLQSVGYRTLYSWWSQHDSLSLPPHKSDHEAADKQAWSLLPTRASVLHARYSLKSRTAPFTYMCLSAQASGRKTRVHAGRWHAGRSLRESRSIALLYFWPRH